MNFLKKSLKKSIGCCVIFFLGLGFIFAHPLDISSTSITLGNNPVVNATTLFHMFEIEYLLKENDIQSRDVGDYYVNQELIKQYVRDNVILSNNDNICKIDFLTIPEKEPHEIFAAGLEVNYSFICEKKPSRLSVMIKFFVNFPLQTNKLTVYSIQNGISAEPLVYKVLNPEFKEYEFDLETIANATFTDTDGDGLSDEDELIYKTDPYAIDTDADFYTDYEEVYGSWNPVNPEISPGQNPRIELPENVLANVKPVIGGTIKKLDDVDAKYTNALDDTWGAGFLKDALEKMSNFSANKTGFGFLSVFLIVILLGFVHAIGPGHSKHILISYVLDKNRGLSHGLLFSLIFTITHVIDIVLLFIITKFLFAYRDPSEYMVLIQKVSVVILLIFSLYLMYRAWSNLKLGKGESCHYDINKESLKGYIILGLVSGLAPCTFGRSLFFLLFALNEIALIIPMLIALAMGIFLCLVMVVILTLYMRNKIYSRVDKLAHYSGLVSSLILFVISIYLIVKIGLV